MTTDRQDELSLHMRIPAAKCFVNNALLTLDGICDHFSFTEVSRDRIRKALEAALNNSIELSYQRDSGLFDLQFSIYKEKLMIMVEDFLLSGSDEVDSNSETIREGLAAIESLTDGFLFTDKKGCNACYSMAFNVSFIEENND